MVAAWQWRGQRGGGFTATATAVPARQQGGPNRRGQTARRPTAKTVMDSVTATQQRQKARRRRNGNGNSNDGDGNGDSDKDGGDGDGWRDGDGRRDGDTTETAAKRWWWQHEAQRRCTARWQLHGCSSADASAEAAARQRDLTIYKVVNK